jgi:hypothetical protein
MSAIRGPDSVAVGHVFTVTATCTNLGAGTSAGGLVRFQHDEGMEAVSPDSLALPSLAPGDSTTVSWIVRPTTVLAFDTTGVGETAITILSSCENGLGEQRQVPLTVHQLTSDDAVPTPPARPLTLQMGIAPNPSSHGTEIWCTLPKSAWVKVEIFDVAGRRISTLFQGISPAGRMALRWNGQLSNGARASGGIYFAQVRVDQKALTRRLVWLQ